MPAYPKPPSGSMPDATVTLRDGSEIDLVPIARAACEQFIGEHPGYTERYGPPGLDWCQHDNQHILSWALTLNTTAQFERELAWLARVLEARAFPLEQLARGIELLAAPLTRAHPELAATAERIAHGAAFLRSRPSFLE